MLALCPRLKKTPNKFQFLHFMSCHSRHTHRGLVRVETIRMLRASSDPLTYAKSLEKIGRMLLAHGYPKRLIDSAFKAVPFSLREELLTPQRIKKAFPGPGCADPRVPYDPAKPPNHIKWLLPKISESQPIQSLLVFEGSKHTAQKIVHSKVKVAPTTKIFKKEGKKVTPLVRQSPPPPPPNLPSD